MKDLSFNVNGETLYLPTWYQLRSDEEIQEAKLTIIEEMILAQSRPADVQVIDEYDIELDKMTEMEEHILRELKKEGFTKDQIEEIFARYYAGETLDSAMQSVI